jgi:hypothetical protein
VRGGSSRQSWGAEVHGSLGVVSASRSGTIAPIGIVTETGRSQRPRLAQHGLRRDRKYRQQRDGEHQMSTVISVGAKP